VYHSVSLCVAVDPSVLQCVAIRCVVLCIATLLTGISSVLQRNAVCCSVLLCVAVCCNVLCRVMHRDSFGGYFQCDAM